MSIFRNKLEIAGLLISGDFQQSFDTVSWQFIDKTLDYFTFGPSIKNLIRLFKTGS